MSETFIGCIGFICGMAVGGISMWAAMSSIIRSSQKASGEQK